MGMRENTVPRDIWFVTVKKKIAYKVIQIYGELALNQFKINK